MFRRTVSVALVLMLVFTAVVAGAPVGLAATYSGHDLVNPPRPADLQFAACNNDGPLFSSTPINIDGMIAQSIDDGKVFIEATSTATNSYVDSGAVFIPHMTLGEFDRAVIAGLLGDDARVNIWIDDAEKDGKFFELGSDTASAGDIYGFCYARAKDGVMVIDTSATFYMMNGSATLDQPFSVLQALYGDREFAFWIGVVGTEAGARLTVDRVIINQPDRIQVDSAWKGLNGTTHEGLVMGIEAFGTIQDALDSTRPGGTISVRPGDYNENLRITKPVTLQGQGDDVNINLQGIGDASTVSIDNTAGDVYLKHLTINGVADESSDDGSNCVYIQGINSFVGIEDCSLQVGVRASDNSARFWDFGYGVTMSDGTVEELRITDCDFHAVSSGRGAMTGVYAGPNVGLLTLDSNSFDGDGFADSALVSAAQLNVISDNTVSATTTLPIGFNLFEVVDASVIGNRFSNVGWPIFFQGAQKGLASRNTFKKCTTGVMVDVPDASKISVNGSDFSSITGVAVENMRYEYPNSTGSVDATENYWGDAGPEGHYTGDVNAYPYCSNRGLKKLAGFPYRDIAVNAIWTGKAPGTRVFIGESPAVIGTSAFSSVADAIKAAHDGDTISVFPGDYPVVSDPTWMADGQDDWYLPITQDGLTLRGVDANGKPITTRPTATSPLPTIFGNDYTANGMWAVQSLVNVLGDNVTITGIAFMPKVEVNKTLELTGANPTVKYCRFEPNTKVAATLGDAKLAEYGLTRADLLADGGCVYVNGSRIMTGASNVELTENYYVKSLVCFDSVQSSGTNRVARSIFDTPWSYYDGTKTVYGYMIGNTTWSGVPTFSGALIEDNTFFNIPTTGYGLIKNRLNGQFTLRGNRMGGQDGAQLVQIITNAYAPGFLCPDASVLIESYVNGKGKTVDTNILVDAAGIHYSPTRHH